MNKKADSKLLSIWWFFVLAFVAGTIVIGVLIFYSADAEVREIEADVLASKIALCLVSQGNLNQNFLKNDFDVFSECNLDKKSLDSRNYYGKISLYNLSGSLLANISFGSMTFEEDCKIQARLASIWEDRAKHFPRCSGKSIYVLNKNEGAVLEIIAGSNNIGSKTSL